MRDLRERLGALEEEEGGGRAATDRGGCLVRAFGGGRTPLYHPLVPGGGGLVEGMGERGVCGWGGIGRAGS